MHQDQCIEIARAAAVACHERHDYMPPTTLLAEAWMPHRWVVDAMLLAAHSAEQERDRYRNGNTTLLEVLMLLCDARPTDAMMQARPILCEAGLMDVSTGALNWHALEARKPKPKTWAEAVNECVTDPEERARLLAFGD